MSVPSHIPGCCVDSWSEAKRAGRKALPVCAGDAAASCMRLPNGATCADCVHVKRCTSLFGVKPTDNVCDFHPRRYQARVVALAPEPKP